MTTTREERLSGQLPATPAELTDDISPAISHEVIASYVADAARSVPGIVELHTSAWKGLSSRRHEVRTGGVEIKDAASDTVDVDIHVSVAWGTVIPEVARQVDAAVREQVLGFINIELGKVTLFVDEIVGPTEDGTPQEG